MAIFKAPILCDCKRTYCSNNCNNTSLGTKKEATYDCRYGDDCGVKTIGTYCGCYR